MPTGLKLANPNSSILKHSINKGNGTISTTGAVVHNKRIFVHFLYNSAMGIEQDIQQTKFRSNRQKAVINIIYTKNFLDEHMRQHFSREDLTPQQYNVLRILRGSNPTPLSTLQIRERMLDKMSDTSRIVDRLVKKELAEKKVCKTDRRLVDVCITENGLSLLERMDVEEQLMDQLTQHLSEEEALKLSNLLDKLRGN